MIQEVCTLNCIKKGWTTAYLVTHYRSGRWHKDPTLILIFRAFGSFLDRALITNDPTSDVLTEIHEYHAVLNALDEDSRIQPMLVLTLGSGSQPPYQIIKKR